MEVARIASPGNFSHGGTLVFGNIVRAFARRDASVAREDHSR